MHGLPAIDTRSGEILVADASGERPFGWDSVALISLRPGAAARTVDLIVDSASIGELHVFEDESEEIRFRDGTAAHIKAQASAANAGFARRALRPLTACHMPADAPMIFCTHPQKICRPPMRGRRLIETAAPAFGQLLSALHEVGAAPGEFWLIRSRQDDGNHRQIEETLDRERALAVTPRKKSRKRKKADNSEDVVDTSALTAAFEAVANARPRKRISADNIT